eukprot:8007451-Pyramimonas_sp.AAC.1
MAVASLEKELAAAKEEAAKALGASTAPPKLDISPLLEQLKQLQTSSGQGDATEAIFGRVAQAVTGFAQKQHTAAPHTEAPAPGGGAHGGGAPGAD